MSEQVLYEDSEFKVVKKTNDSGSEVQEAPEVAYPDPMQTDFMIHAKAELARWTEIKAYADPLASIVDYRKASDLIHYTNRVGSSMPGSDTMGMTALTVEPTHVGLWPLGDGQARKAGTPEEADELVRRLDNSQKCYSAAQMVKQAVMTGPWPAQEMTRYGMALRRFLEEGDVTAFKQVADIWHSYWTTIVQCWPKSKYAPEPWKLPAPVE